MREGQASRGISDCAAHGADVLTSQIASHVWQATIHGSASPDHLATYLETARAGCASGTVRHARTTVPISRSRRVSDDR